MMLLKKDTTNLFWLYVQEPKQSSIAFADELTDGAPYISGTYFTLMQYSHMRRTYRERERSVCMHEVHLIWRPNLG